MQKRARRVQIFGVWFDDLRNSLLLWLQDHEPIAIRGNS
jgi:hypothetical protein